MNNPLKKTEALINQQVHKVTHRTREAFNQELEEIVNKTIVSPEIEKVVVKAVERVIFSLIKRYWKYFSVSLLGLLLLQSLILGLMLREG
ncbi:MAG: hypothetical protein EA365_07200 [Gloeocapsa sp. DLM2.Bin57]|nr:MAG: hypothetical protein EA365_07200 [Gloeocapsa sp. DLM2.Bin57]